MTDMPTTLVLLDPTSDDGETALDLLDRCDDQIALVVLLSCRSSSALRDFAHSEDIDVTTAAWIYLDQVVERIDCTGRAVQTIVATGPSAADELVDLTRTMVPRRILLPSSIDHVDRRSRETLRERVAAPVVTAPRPLLVS